MALTAEDQERLVAELEIALDRLQALYNQYFMGIEKLEPTIPRKDVERKIQLLRREKIRNTAVRFRFQTQIQKYNTHTTYWRRICRQIEEGTYQRDVMRAQKRTRQKDDAEIAAQALGALGSPSDPPPPPPVVDLSEEMGMDLDDPFAEQARRPTAPPTYASIPAPATMSDTPTAPPGKAEGMEQPKFAAPYGGDPDKTPVPTVGTGIHKLHERLIEDARKGAGDREEDDLSSFFARRSVPPPPPREGTPPPPPPKTKPPLPRPGVRAQVSKPTPRAVPVPAKLREATPPGTRRGPDEDRMKAVYRAYVSARKKTNEPTDNISYAKVSKLLSKQVQEKGAVDFKVVIRQGKAVIKSVKE